MNTILFHPNTKKQEKMLTELAKELGISTKILSAEELEESMLAKEISKGEKTPLVNYSVVKKEFQKLRKKLSNGK